MKSTILVVGDDEAIRKLLREGLGEDYNIIETDEGYGGLSEIVIGEQKIDLIITDLQMHGCDGIEFLRNLPEGIPFIIVSGFLHLLKFQEALKGLHPAAVFEKPFRIHALREAIQNALAP